MILHLLTLLAISDMIILLYSPLQAKWFKGNEELKPSDRVKMDITPTHAILTVKEADKDDEGPYRVEIENDLGKDKADLKAEVNQKEGNHDTII